MHPTTIGVDLAKTVFEIAISDRPGHVRERHRVPRARFMPFFAERQPATVLLEACGSAHHWARCLQELGHTVHLLPAHSVRPYVGRNKTDRADAKGILEAFRNEEIHPVPVKTIDQQTLTSLHRIRSAWMSSRNSRINTVRALLREIGIILPVGSRNVVPSLWAQLEDADSNIPDALRPALAETAHEIREMEERVQAIENSLTALGQQIPTVAHLRSVPGIGLLTSTALVAFVGDVNRFPSGRHFASYLGLTPREYSSGSIRRLGKISKRGDRYHRMLLIHGARAVLSRAKEMESPDRLRSWALGVAESRGRQKATVALANKLARIAWAVWKYDHDYQGTKEAA